MENRAFKNAIFRNERVTGIEPVSRPWQGRIKAIILYPLNSILFYLFVPSPRIELGTQGFSVLCSTTELTRQNFNARSSALPLLAPQFRHEYCRGATSAFIFKTLWIL